MKPVGTMTLEHLMPILLREIKEMVTKSRTESSWNAVSCCHYQAVIFPCLKSAWWMLSAPTLWGIQDGWTARGTALPKWVICQNRGLWLPQVHPSTSWIWHHQASLNRSVASILRDIPHSYTFWNKSLIFCKQAQCGLILYYDDSC